MSEAGAAASCLSAREVEVLAGAADGKSHDEIAVELVISALTVQTHMRRIYVKLGARNRAHAVALAIRGGMLR